MGTLMVVMECGNDVVGKLVCYTKRGRGNSRGDGVGPLIRGVRERGVRPGGAGTRHPPKVAVHRLRGAAPCCAHCVWCQQRLLRRHAVGQEGWGPNPSSSGVTSGVLASANHGLARNVTVQSHSSSPSSLVLSLTQMTRRPFAPGRSMPDG